MEVLPVEIHRVEPEAVRQVGAPLQTGLVAVRQVGVQLLTEPAAVHLAAAPLVVRVLVDQAVKHARGTKSLCYHS